MDEQWTTHDLDAEALGTDALLEREWLLTNATGGYSMGTALGANTRRYHGLLVAATHPPVGRVVALNQTIDQLLLTKPHTFSGSTAGARADDAHDTTQTVELSSALFPESGGDENLKLVPQGHELLRRFEKGLAARWTYGWGSVAVVRTLVLHDRRQAITLRYDVTGLDESHGRATLAVTPLLTLRDFHGLTRRDDPPSFALSSEGDQPQLTVERGSVAVTMRSSAGSFAVRPDWWFNAAYPRDTHRGQGDREDYFAPGRFEIALSPGPSQGFTLTAALGEEPAEPRDVSSRSQRLGHVWPKLPGAGRVLQQKALAIAADDFVVGRTLAGGTLPGGRDQQLSTIVAGYPWFADWGRDTFIALPGLLLTTGRHNEARDVLRAFAGAIRDGLVPNRFDDYDDSAAHYNTVDASLWYVHAGLEYMKAADESPGWLTRAMRAIVEAYAAGTAAEGHDGRPLPIAMDADGLIAAGDERSQLTWMDAACGDAVFTPRPGKCVEINALWYHALMGLSEHLAPGNSGSDASTADAKTSAGYAKLAAKVKRSFTKTFWSDPMNRLIDHVTPAGVADPSLRPNMVFACSLAHSPLPATKRRLVLAAIERSLLTPVGLRTLPADDPQFHPHYGGPQFQRDEAYHQGTIWPWLIGPYAEGVLRAGKFSRKAKAQAAAALQPLLDRLMREGLGQLHEIFDGDVSHAGGASGGGASGGRGCIAQAWSVAELIRVLALVEGAEGPSGQAAK